MAVETPIQPDHTVQTSGTNYKAAINNGVSAIKQVADNFASHEQTVPDMTVRLEAGRLFDFATLALTEKTAQNTLTLTAPTTNPRKDIVHIDRITGVVDVATGVEAASPVDPAIPAGEIPVARVTLQTTTTEIANSIIDDLRTMQDSTVGGVKSVQVFTADGTWTKPAGINNIRAQVVGGGGGGARNTASEAAAGGGGGGYAEEFIDVTGTSSEVVTVGTGGNGATADNTNGSAGGTSSLGSLLSATGGGGGDDANLTGGTGGVGSGGDVNAAGDGGGSGDNAGGSAGSGGGSYFGGGARGRAGGNITGFAGEVFGGGGGGGAGAANGGNGAAGVVIVWEYS